MKFAAREDPARSDRFLLGAAQHGLKKAPSSGGAKMRQNIVLSHFRGPRDPAAS
jgi:hypothetical protein